MEYDMHEDDMHEDDMHEDESFGLKTPVWVRHNVDAKKLMAFLRARIEESTYDKVAEKIGVHVSSIYMLTMNRRVPRRKMLKKIVKAYDLNIEDYQLLSYPQAILLMVSYVLLKGSLPVKAQYMTLDKQTIMSYKTLFGIHPYYKVMEDIGRIFHGDLCVDKKFIKRRTDEELIQVLRSKAIELGRTPKACEVPQSQTICHRFKDITQESGKNVGGWNRALLIAGLKPLRDVYMKTRHKRKRVSQ